MRAEPLGPWGPTGEGHGRGSPGASWASGGEPRNWGEVSLLFSTLQGAPVEESLVV